MRVLVYQNCKTNLLRLFYAKPKYKNKYRIAFGVKCSRYYLIEPDNKRMTELRYVFDFFQFSAVTFWVQKCFVCDFNGDLRQKAYNTATCNNGNNNNQYVHI